MHALSLANKMIWLSQRGSDRDVWSSGVGLLFPEARSVNVKVGEDKRGHQLFCVGEWLIEQNNRLCRPSSMLSLARGRGVSISELLAYWHDYDHPYLMDFRIVKTPQFHWQNKTGGMLGNPQTTISSETFSLLR